MRLIPALTLAALAGCTSFPELDAAQTPGIENAPYPQFVPIETLLADDTPVSTTPEAMEEVAARVAALRARAARLSAGPVIDNETRARMARGVVEG